MAAFDRWLRSVLGTLFAAPSRRRPFSRLTLEVLEERTVPAAGLFDLPQTLAAGSRPAAAVVGDFNHDGYPDVAVLNTSSNSVSIFTNDGTGSLLLGGTFSTNASPILLAQADVNHDGNTDLIVVDANGEVDYLPGTGGGTFNAPVKIVDSSITAIVNPVGMAVGDFLGDGNTGIALTGTNSGGASYIDFLDLNGAGVLSGGVSAGDLTGAFGAVTATDFNHDGFTDVIVDDFKAGSSSNKLYYFSGSSSGVQSNGVLYSFVNTNTPVTGIVSADFNGDGKKDLAVAFGSDVDPQVLFGDGSGGITGTSTIVAGGNGAVVAADFDGDGVPDLAFVDPVTGNLSVQLNDGTGNFTAAAGSPLNGVSDLGGTGLDALAAGDFNADGGADLVAVNGSTNSIGLLLCRFRTTTAVTLNTGANPTTVGQSLTFLATVRAYIDAGRNSLLGSVQFYDNQTPLGSPVPINLAGQASLTTGLAAGLHSITAHFSGNFGFAPSTSGPYIEQVNEAPTVTTQPTNQTVVAGGNVSFTAAATDGYPTPTTVKWQISTNGGSSFSDLSDGGVYSGVLTTTLHITGATAALNGDQYRAVFSNSAPLSATSTAATLTIATFNVADFSGYGVQFFDTQTSSWQVLSAVDAALLGVSAGGVVVADFPGYGVLSYNVNNYSRSQPVVWQHLVAAAGNLDAQLLSVAANGIVAADFAAYGVYLYDPANSSLGWQQLSKSDPTLLSVGGNGSNGYVVADFSPYGVDSYYYNSASPGSDHAWDAIGAVNATLLAVNSNGDIYGNFQGYGVDKFVSGTTWASLGTPDASALAVNLLGQVAANFNQYGVYVYSSGTGWQSLNTVNASLLALNVDGQVVGDFPPNGIMVVDLAGFSYLGYPTGGASLLAVSQE